MAKQKKTFRLHDFETINNFLESPAFDEMREKELQAEKERREAADLLRYQQREIRRKFQRHDFKLQILRTDRTLLDGMLHYEGIDAIEEGLKNLKVGEVAVMRIERTREYYRHDPRYTKVYGFRRITRSENDESTWELKSHRDYQMVDTKSYWGKSCFSEWDLSIEANIERMRDHDEEDDIQAMEMIVFNALDEGYFEHALMYIQDECYNASRLKLEGCRQFEKVFSDLETEVTAGDMFDYAKVKEVW